MESSKKTEYVLKESVKGSTGLTKYQCTIEWRNGNLIVDEPLEIGGKDTGPDPYTLLLSSLASCALITLRMYIDRKGWDIPNISINCSLFRLESADRTSNFIDSDISFPGANISTEQKNRLREIAQHCPISKIIEGNTKVRSFVLHNEDTDRKKLYSNEEITVVWKPEFCQHSGRCVTYLPNVFDVNKRPWVTINGAENQAIIDTVNSCPSGALSFSYNKKEGESNKD